MNAIFKGLIITALFACLASPTAAQTPATRPEIVLGMSTALSGPAANLGKDMRQGVLAGLERANRAGGVNGQSLRLIALDDSYEPAMAAPNMRQLIEKDQVLAIIGNVGTPTAVAAVPIALEQKVPFFAAYTGAGVLRRNPPDRYVINYRASYAEETGAMIDALFDSHNLRPQDIAFFTQRDGYGDAGFAGGIQALKRHGLTDEKQVIHVRYERNTTAVENALATLLYADREPKAIIMVGAYKPCAKFIRLAHDAGLKSLFLNVSFVGSNSLAEQLGDLPVNVVVTQVVPHPLATELPIVREYQADLAALDPAAKPGFGSLEGYIAARVFIAGLSRVQDVPTREKIIDALESLGDFNLGLGVRLHYGPRDHQACHQVWPTILRNGSFVQFDWKELGNLLQKDPQP